METFLLLYTAQSDAAALSRTLNKSSEILHTLFKAHNTTYIHEQLFNQSPQFGLLTVQNKNIESHTVIDVHSTDTHLVVFYGSLYEKESKSPAKTAYQEYLKSGIAEVKRLEGCFSVAIINKLEKTVELFGDNVGQRTLRYATFEGGIVISPHDICLISTGKIPLEIDYVSAASVAAFGWSLNECSLLKNIRVCRPYDALTWQSGQMSSSRHLLIQPQATVDPSDKQGMHRQNELILDEMVGYTAKILARGEQPIAELSAGIDSRAVLSILLACTEASNIQSFSAGAADSLDVVVAKEIASRLGVPFSNRNRPPRKLDGVMVDLNHAVLATNGSVNSLSTMTNDPINFSQYPKLSFCGAGGEIFRGYYYPPSFLGITKSLDRHSVFKKLLSKSSIHKIEWNDRGFPTAVQQRLFNIISLYGEQTSSAHTMLDLFYTWERFGIWNAKTQRTFRAANRVSPFFSRKAIQLAYRLPHPIGDRTTAHAYAIRKYAKSCYRIPINNEVYLPLKYGSPLLRLLGDSVELSHKLQRRLVRINRRKQRAASQRRKDLEAQRIRYFNEVMRDDLYQLLESPISASLTLFGKEQFEHMVSCQLSGVPTYAGVLATMLSVETFLKSCYAAVESSEKAVWPNQVPRSA